jgi:hypothetical protein
MNTNIKSWLVATGIVLGTALALAGTLAAISKIFGLGGIIAFFTMGLVACIIVPIIIYVHEMIS